VDDSEWDMMRKYAWIEMSLKEGTAKEELSVMDGVKLYDC